MNQASAVQATIKGDVSGQVAVGNYILQMGDVNGGIVNFAPPSDQPAYSRRPLPVNLRPRAFPSFLDHTDEFISVQTALQNSTPISIYGEEGIGKTSFIRKLAYLPEIETFPDGVVYLDAPGRGRDDLLQFLFDAFYESAPEFKPRDAEIRVALQSLKALIFIDSLNLQRHAIQSLLDAVPNCIFVLSSVERSLWGEGQMISLRGLPERDAVALFERELGRAMSEEEHATAKKICALLKGHPLRIVQAASLIHETSKPISDILEELEDDIPENAVLQASLRTLGEHHKRDLAILAAAGGFIVPLEHVASLSQDPKAQKTLRELIALGLVQAHSPRYSLTGNLASAFATLWDLSPWEDQLLGYFIRWLEGQPTPALIQESSDVLLHTVKRAGAKEQWSQVIRLGRLLEQELTVWKRWQAWADVLHLILKAARALGDRKVEGWALHQLGTRAMCLGQAQSALQLLSEALSIRKAIHDRAGQAITQHNLNVLLNDSGTSKGGKSGPRPWFMAGGALLIALLMTAMLTYTALSLFATTIAPQVTNTLISIPSSTSTATATQSPSPTATTTPTPTATTTSTLTLTPTAVVVGVNPVVSSTHPKKNKQKTVVTGSDPSWSPLCNPQLYDVPLCAVTSQPPQDPATVPPPPNPDVPFSCPDGTYWDPNTAFCVLY